jgi:uncharacterized membrane protein YkoI
MIRMTLVERYLEDLRAALPPLPRALTKRLLEEASGHLRRAVESGLEQGLTLEQAQLTAVSRFGPPDAIARAYGGWATEPSPALRWGISRRVSSKVAAGVAVIVLAAAGGLATASSLAGGPGPPGAAQVGGRLDHEAVAASLVLRRHSSSMKEIEHEADGSTDAYEVEFGPERHEVQIAFDRSLKRVDIEGARSRDRSIAAYVHEARSAARALSEQPRVTSVEREGEGRAVYSVEVAQRDRDVTFRLDDRLNVLGAQVEG